MCQCWKKTAEGPTANLSIPSPIKCCMPRTGMRRYRVLYVILLKCHSATPPLFRPGTRATCLEQHRLAELDGILYLACHV